jgi:hypothetical protein
LSLRWSFVCRNSPPRQQGVTLGQIAERRLKVPELQKASLVIRAQSYRRRLFEEIEKAKGCSCRERPAQTRREQAAESDFIDNIAELLPAEQRPLWYRGMAHLRRLPL